MGPPLQSRGIALYLNGVALTNIHQASDEHEIIATIPDAASAKDQTMTLAICADPLPPDLCCGDVRALGIPFQSLEIA